MLYVVSWNAGYGIEHAVVDRNNKVEATAAARNLCLEEVENSASYAVVGEATEELCEYHGLDIDDIAN